MSRFLLIHGASSNPAYWSGVADRLIKAGHQPISAQLPTGDADALLNDYAAAAGRDLDPTDDDLVVVGQSMGAYTAAIVAARHPCRAIVLVAPMIPLPGESPGRWFSAVDQATAQRTYAAEAGFRPGLDPLEILLHDVDPNHVERLMAAGEPPQGEAVFSDPFPLDAWPDTPTHIIAPTLDRLIPYELQQRLARERLDKVPIPIHTGHLPAFANPTALTDALMHASL